MDIECVVLGDFQTNCYVVRSSPHVSECLIIDPGFEPRPLIELLRAKLLVPEQILLTHGHCDHIAGIPLLMQDFGKMPVHICAEDAPMLSDGRRNLAFMLGESLHLDPPDELLEAGGTVQYDGVELEILATPGHTPGSVSFYCRKEAVVFSGDSLFAGSIGRTDFPGGDAQQLLQSIREALLVLPEATRVFTGHGPATDIATEKRSNPFLVG